MTGNDETCMIIMVVIFAVAVYYLFISNNKMYATSSNEHYSNEEPLNTNNSDYSTNDTSNLVSIEPDSDTASEQASSSEDESIQLIRKRAKGKNNVKSHSYRNTSKNLDGIKNQFNVRDVTSQSNEHMLNIEQDEEQAPVNIQNVPATEKDKYNLDNYLPLETKDNDWFETIETTDVKNRHLINIYRPCGVNTSGSSHKNVSQDIRGEPPCPKETLGPWYQSSIEPDVQFNRNQIGTECP